MGNKLERMQKQALAEIQEKIFAPNTPADSLFSHIPTLSPIQLRRELLARKFTLQNVVEAFHARKQREKNVHFALADVFYTEPLEEAGMLQRRLEAGHDLPLLGFVLSVKDTVLMKGTRSTSGLAANFEYRMKEKAPFIDYLKEKGALILSKGNVPQALMGMETLNNIFNETLNPLDTARSPGGSSGGDAALVRLMLANAAVATDGAGSLRIPANFCGLSTMKVTARRFFNPACRFYTLHPQRGKYEDAGRVMESVAGLLTQHVADLDTFMRVFNDYNRVDGYLPPIPWQPVSAPRRLGCFSEVAHCPLPDANRRAMSICRQRLAREGYTLVDLDLNFMMPELHTTVIAAIFKDQQLMNILRRKPPTKEPLMHIYKKLARVAEAPIAILKMSKKFLSSREKILIDGAIEGKTLTASELIERQEHYRREMLRIFAQAKVDVALFPAFPPAVLRGTSNECTLLAVYTFIWNFVDFVAGTLSVTRVLADEQHFASSYDDPITTAIDKNMKGAAGLPVSVQLIGIPYAEERVLATMVEVERVAGFVIPRDPLLVSQF